ncbi:hypothetical protein MM221_16215 [Salipaludibacillus sp. LMS25]|jgi:hypothetical protein|uniref:hypothetical protein n=1 Tax=Salipaludibacillus sp. LMS25 TaxID=2924031 RepID=UPI0020D14953|nr:hypothetical protein [Salipaludibacillus sp. LMS25]UTR14110.1 hypothetical protein MM221_16215 [Salipaludibacillus sp. LMS25]
MKKTTFVGTILASMLVASVVSASSTYYLLEKARDDLKAELDEEFSSYLENKKELDRDELLEAEAERMYTEVFAYFESAKEEDEKKDDQFKEDVKIKTDGYIEELKHYIDRLFHHN